MIISQLYAEEKKAKRLTTHRFVLILECRYRDGHPNRELKFLNSIQELKIS